jgi:hypothetical protein
VAQQSPHALSAASSSWAAIVVMIYTKHVSSIGWGGTHCARPSLPPKHILVNFFRDSVGFEFAPVRVVLVEIGISAAHRTIFGQRPAVSMSLYSIEYFTARHVFTRHPRVGANDWNVARSSRCNTYYIFTTVRAVNMVPTSFFEG